MMTPDKLIKALGGTQAVADHMGQTYQAIHNWIQSDRVPKKAEIKVWQLCVQRGVPWQPPGTEGWTLVRGDRANG